MSNTISLWRCTQCGKWSHAQRKPKRHERFQREEPDDPASVIHYEPPTYYGPESLDEGGYKVACGPFSEWRATPVDGGAA